jgi:hypothetical protein
MNNHFTDGMNEDELRMAGCDSFDRAITFFLYKQVIGTGASYTKKDAASYFSYVIDKLKKLGIDADIVEDEIFGDDRWTLRMPTIAVETARNNISRNHS